MFNPNDSKYDKVYPSYEKLMDEVSDYEVYRYYIGEFIVGKPFNSPLSKDKNPSFGIFPSKKVNGSLFFKDHRGASGDVVNFVKHLFNLSKYTDALERIIIDFNLGNKFIINNIDFKQLKPVEYRLNKDSRKKFSSTKLNLDISVRKWNINDLRFWNQFGISLNTLNIFNVVPIKYYWMNNKIFKADNYAYAYKEYKDGIINYKIYQPFRESRDNKFLNGFLDGTFSGWGLLPDEVVDLIIITKSTKDVMFLYEYGYNAVSPQGEGYIFKPQVIDILKSKANRILTFYDHDNAGIKSAERNRKDFGFEFITTFDFNSKDITDYYKKYKEIETKKLLKEILK